MASPGSASSASSVSEEDHKQVERKQRRMLSNRESARRSRLRKQKHLDGLAAQIAQLRNDNNQIATRLNITTQHYLNVESENSVLRAQMAELSNRLESLNEITHYLNATGSVDFDEASDHQSLFVNPWSSLCLNQQQPMIVASAEMLE